MDGVCLQNADATVGTGMVPFRWRIAPADVVLVWRQMSGRYEELR